MLLSPLLDRMIGDATTAFAVQETTEAPCPPDGPKPLAPLHLHRSDDEGFYALEGRLVIQVGEEQLSVPDDACTLVPHGMPHTYWNPDPAPVHYLLIMPPRLRALVNSFEEDPDHPEPEMRALCERYAQEVFEKD